MSNSYTISYIVYVFDSDAFPNKRSGIHRCFSQKKGKSHSNLEQGLRLECKQGSEKTAGKQSLEEPTHRSLTMLSFVKQRTVPVSLYLCAMG